MNFLSSLASFVKNIWTNDTSSEPEEPKTSWAEYVELDYPVIYSFIEEVEGSVKKGYVPRGENKVPLGRSGVTIGIGLDLGQRKHLDDLNLGLCLERKLEPYLGLTKWAAVNKLNEVPLILDQSELSILNNRIIESKLKYVYLLLGEKLFWSFTKPVRTAIFSVIHQYGNIKVRTPKFYQHVINKNIDGMVNELRNFGDKYPTRRNKEADLIERNIT